MPSLNDTGRGDGDGDPELDAFRPTIANFRPISPLATTPIQVAKRTVSQLITPPNTTKKARLSRHRASLQGNKDWIVENRPPQSSASTIQPGSYHKINVAGELKTHHPIIEAENGIRMLSSATLSKLDTFRYQPDRTSRASSEMHGAVNEPPYAPIYNQPAGGDAINREDYGFSSPSRKRISIIGNEVDMFHLQPKARSYAPPLIQQRQSNSEILANETSTTKSSRPPAIIPVTHGSRLRSNGHRSKQPLPSPYNASRNQSSDNNPAHSRLSSPVLGQERFDGNNWSPLPPFGRRRSGPQETLPQRGPHHNDEAGELLDGNSTSAQRSMEPPFDDSDDDGNLGDEDGKGIRDLPVGNIQVTGKPQNHHWRPNMFSPGLKYPLHTVSRVLQPIHSEWKSIPLHVPANLEAFRSSSPTPHPFDASLNDISDVYRSLVEEDEDEDEFIDSDNLLSDLELSKLGVETDRSSALETSSTKTIGGLTFQEPSGRKLQWNRPTIYKPQHRSSPALSKPSLTNTAPPTVTTSTRSPCPTPQTSSSSGTIPSPRSHPSSTEIAPHIIDLGADGTPIPFGPYPIPASARDRSPIPGLSGSPRLAICFRIGEALSAAAVANRANADILIELYARVRSSHRDGHKQHFEFADLFQSEKPPFLAGVWVGWRESECWANDGAALLGEGRDTVCRAVGRCGRDERNAWRFTVLSAWEASWEDVAVAKGIVSG